MLLRHVPPPPQVRRDRAPPLFLFRWERRPRLHLQPLRSACGCQRLGLTALLLLWWSMFSACNASDLAVVSCVRLFCALLCAAHATLTCRVRALTAPLSLVWCAPCVLLQLLLVLLRHVVSLYFARCCQRSTCHHLRETTTTRAKFGLRNLANSSTPGSSLLLRWQKHALTHTIS